MLARGSGRVLSPVRPTRRTLWMKVLTKPGDGTCLRIAAMVAWAADNPLLRYIFSYTKIYRT
jgi:hypothetical protein